MKQSNDDLAQFMESTSARNVSWYLDDESEEVVTVCECCGAEARHTEQELEENFQFTHDENCQCRERNDVRAPDAAEDHAYELALGISNILDDEPDSDLVADVLAFVAAVVVVTEAEELGSSTEVVAEEFVLRFRHQMTKVGQSGVSGTRNTH